jgi:hypothetical protein
MKYEFSLQAKDVMHERGIATDLVLQALNFPTLIIRDDTDTSLEHRLAVIHDYDGRVLRVIINTDTNPNRVVTAYFDRKMKGKL